MHVISKTELTPSQRQDLRNWTINEKDISRDFKLKDFVDAFSFMTAIALEAEKMNHHPDWYNSYDILSIKLSTHSEGGFTQLDVDLASTIDHIYMKYQGS